MRAVLFEMEERCIQSGEAVVHDFDDLTGDTGRQCRGRTWSWCATFEPSFEYADLDDRVLAWGSIHVRARGSGIETDVETGGLFEFRDGKIVRWEDFGSKQKALEAAGLRE